MLSLTKSLSMPDLRATYMYVALGLVVAILSGYLMYPHVQSITGGAFFGLVVLELVAIFAIFMTKNIATYLFFTAINGITFVPIISHFITTGQADTILVAAIGTAVIFIGLSIYALTTTKNFLSWQGIMFWILLGLIVVGVLNIFIGSSILHFLFSAIAIVVFSIYIIIDTQQILLEGNEPLFAATALYLDVVNIFINLLSLLGDSDD